MEAHAVGVLDTGIAVTMADRGVRYFLVRVTEFTTRQPRLLPEGTAMHDRIRTDIPAGIVRTRQVRTDAGLGRWTLLAWIPDPDRPDIQPQDRFIWASYAVTDDEDPGRLPVNMEWRRGPEGWHVGADRYDTQTAAIEAALRIWRGR